jgi:hypothetical protein
MERETMVKIARRLKRELDELHNECVIQHRAGQDYTALWARSGGVFYAYKLLADELGWQ